MGQRELPGQLPPALGICHGVQSPLKHPMLALHALVAQSGAVAWNLSGL